MAIRVCLANMIGLLVMDSISLGMASTISMCEDEATLSFEESFDLDFVAYRTVSNNAELLTCSCLISFYLPVKASFADKDKPVYCGCSRGMCNITLLIWEKTNWELVTYELENLPFEDTYEDITNLFLSLTMVSTCSFNFNFEFSGDNPVSSQVICSRSTTETSWPSPISSPGFSRTESPSKILPSVTSFYTFGNGTTLSVGGAAIFATAILLFIFICRRRARPSQLMNPAVSEEDGHSSKYNAYTTLGPALPASAPYDNLTISKERENGKPYGSAPVYTEITSTATGTQATDYNVNGVGDNAFDRITDSQKGSQTVTDYDNSLQPSVPPSSDKETTVIDNYLYGK